MYEIACRQCRSRIRIDLGDTSHRFCRRTCGAVLIESRGVVSVVYEFVRGSAVILS
jgi:hypothetical protein